MADRVTKGTAIQPPLIPSAPHPHRRSRQSSSTPTRTGVVEEHGVGLVEEADRVVQRGVVPEGALRQL